MLILDNSSLELRIFSQYPNNFYRDAEIIEYRKIISFSPVSIS